MKSAFAALTFTVLAAASSLAHAQEPPPAYPPMPPAPGYAPMPPPVPPPPSTGTGLVVTGAIFTGVGGINLVTAPICKTSAIQPNVQNLCLGLSIGLGVGFAAIGIPLLIVGIGKRDAYREWKKQNNVIGRLTDLGFAPAPGGGAVTWQTAF
jgi:hypothetical protein